MQCWLTFACITSDRFRSMETLVNIRTKRVVVQVVGCADHLTGSYWVSATPYVYRSPKEAAEFYIQKLPGVGKDLDDEDVVEGCSYTLSQLYVCYAKALIGMSGKVKIHRLTYEWNVELAELLTHDKLFWRQFAAEYVLKSGTNPTL